MQVNTTVPHPSVDQNLMQTERDNRKRATLEEYLNPALAASPIPSVTLTTEKPVHRTIAYLLVAGRTRKEICESLSITDKGLRDIIQQPWFQVLLKGITDAAGKDMVKSYLEGEVIPSLEVLRTIRDNPAEKGATRVTACTSLLDRFLGKPVAHIESTATLNIHNAGSAASTVETELARVDAQLKALRGIANTSATGNS